MKKVIISTDSTCDMPNELKERLGINYVHCPVILGDKAYFDGVDIKPRDVYDYCERTGTLPKTSALNSGDYGDVFASLSDGGKNAVIHFIISSESSGSYNFARLAAEDFEDVYVVDSRLLSGGMALAVVKAAQMRDEGKDAKEIFDFINDYVNYIDTSFIIDTLEYLHKGGRCSSVALLGANILKLKPCIEMTEGVMEVAQKYRGRLKDVLSHYVEDKLKDKDDIDDETCFICHTVDDDSIVEGVKEQVLQTIPFKNVYVCHAGCQISAHCGPGTLGVLFVRKTKKVKNK